MRWPLRLQIMLPMSVVMLVLLAGVSVLNACLSVQRTKLRIQQQLRDVARTLTDSSFPLTDTVLLRMRGLSGADFLLTDQQEGVIAATRVEPAWQAVAGRLRTDAAEISLALPISVSGERYYHAVVQLRRPQISNQPLLLHVLYPEQTYTEALWQAVLPPIIVGGVALLVVMLIGIAVASRVTNPFTSAANPGPADRARRFPRRAAAPAR